MTSLPQRWRVPLAAAGALAAVAAGLPGSLGIALGANPFDWRVPFGLQHAGGFGLRTAIYASGFLLFFGAIVLLGLAVRAIVGPRPGVVPAMEAEKEGHVPIVEPLFGFLPAAVQLRLAAETGYHALLYTKLSILLTFGCGVLLAGSWIPVSEFEPVPPRDAVVVLAGLYLLAESAHRYIVFSKGRPSGALVGYLLYGLAGPLLRPGRR
jgi:hypothetical protein